MARWRRGDTEAFNAVTSAGEKLRTAYEKSQLGQAYREGGEVTKPEDQAQLDDYKAQGLGARQSIDENNWYTPGTPEGAAAEAQNASAARLAKSYDQSYDAGSKYRVGSQSYDQAPTPQQLHRGGLERQMAFLASRGDVEGASTLGERISGLDTAAQQRELVKGQLAMQPGQLEAQKLGLENAKGKRERAKLADDAGKEYRDALKDPLAAAQKLFNSNVAGAGQGNYANQDAQYVRGKDGKHTVWFVDKETGDPVLGSIRTFTDQDAKRLVTDAYFHKLSSIDPEFAFRNADRVEKSAHQTRMEDLEEKKQARELKQDRMEWGEVDADGKRVPGSGWRGEYLTAMQNKGAAGGRGNVQEVTWKDDTGAVRTGRVGLEMIGRRLVAYDIATGKDLPTDDPRYQAIINGAPKNSKNDPESNPEIANIQAKIKKGEATPEDITRFRGLVKLDSLRGAFDTDASEDRMGAVTGLFTKGVFGPGGMAESPAAQNEIAATLGITRAELDMARSFARKKPAQDIPRRFQQAPSVPKRVFGTGFGS